MVSFPLAKNKFMVRLENLADAYTSQGAATQNATQSVKLDCIGAAYWNSANVAHPVGIKGIQVSEKSLTGNMDIEEFKERKIQWKVAEQVDPLWNTDNGMVVTLVPQQIRVFTVEVEPESDEQFLN
jgi:hypothetical protein